MKNSFFKYIFIIFVIGIIIFTIYMIYFKKDKPENEVVQLPVEEMTEIKDLRLGISNFDTINPLLTNNKEIINIDKLIFEPLLTIDENYKIKLCLATEWSKTSPTSYVIKIDNNKKWSDGTPMIAKDIQFTIDRIKEGTSVYSYNLQKISSVQVVDASTVRINLFEEDPFFEYNLTFPILPNNYYLGENFATSTKTPIGTGMYKIESMNASSITLVRNEKWWNKNNVTPKIDKITIKLFAEIGELYNSFKLGNIDIFTTSNSNLEQYIGTIGYSKVEFKGREFDYLAFNCQDDVLKNKEVRKAIYYAIDKSNIISSIYNNQKCIADFPLDYGNYLYNKEITNEYNIDQAKTVLSTNEWTYTGSRWQKLINRSTTRINLSLTVNSEDEQRVAIAENIQNSLEQAGIKLSINKVSASRYKKVLEDKNYQMILTGVYDSYSPNLETFFGNDNLQNYNNDEISKILNEVKSITDENLLKEKYKRIIEIYEEERPFVGLSRNKVSIIKGQTLGGEIKGNNYFSYYGIDSWHRI